MSNTGSLNRDPVSSRDGAESDRRAGGKGKRLFRDADQIRRLRLVDSKTTSTGGAMLTNQPAR